MVSLLIIKSEKINLTHIKHVTLNKYYGTLVLILNFFNVLRKEIGEVYKKNVIEFVEFKARSWHPKYHIAALRDTFYLK